MLKVEYEIESASGRDTQAGYMNMFVGAISAIRNPKAHENMTISKDDAIRKENYELIEHQEALVEKFRELSKMD